MSFPKTVTELLAVEEPIIRGWITEQIGDHAASNDPGDQFEFEFSGLADGDTLYYDGNAFEWKNTSQLQIDPTNNTVTVSDGKLYIDDGNAVNAALITTDYSIISAEGTAVGLSLVVAGTDPLYRGVIKGVRSRGTVGSPSVPSVDDSVFSILGAIYDGIDTEGTAQINFIVDGSVSSDVAPQRIAFMTSATTGLARAERLQIKSNGDIIINNTGVASDVTIKGDNDATLFVLDGGSDVLAFGGAVDASYKLKVYGNIWGTGTLTIDGATTYNGAMIIDVNSAEALLVRKDGDLGDVFVVDTVTPKLVFGVDTIQYGETAGGSGGITYKDSGSSNRFGLHFPGSDIVALANRASNGIVQIKANTSTAGAGGELVVTTFEDDIVTVSHDVGKLQIKGTDVTVIADQVYAAIEFYTADGSSFGDDVMAKIEVRSEATAQNYGNIHIQTRNHGDAGSDPTWMTALYLNYDGYVGVRHTEPAYPLHVSETYTSTSGTEIATYFNATVNPSGNSTATYRAFHGNVEVTSGNTRTISIINGAQMDVKHGGTNTLSTSIGLSGTIRIDNSGAITNATGLRGNIVTNATKSGNISDARAIVGTTQHLGSGTITNLYLLRANDDSGGGTITNTYGVYVDAITSGGTLNYSIYTNAGISYFGDKVGILATSPSAQLHVDQSSASGAVPVLYLDQADVSEEMIEFNTTIGVGNAIEAIGGKSLTTTHFIKVTLPGALTRYIPCGTIA
jgi:hypothetical protein